MKTTATFILFTILSVSHYSFTQKGNWISMEEAVQLQETEEHPKKIFVDVYTDWCGWCKRMDASTFSNDSLIAEMERMYYLVKLDAEQKDDITIKGHTYKFVPGGRNGYHELAAELLQGSMSYPSYTFISTDTQIIHVLPGYQDVATFGKIAAYIGDDIYLTKTWEEYLKP